MAQTPGDEWFAPDDAKMPPDAEGRPAEDDWLVAAEPRGRRTTFDMWALTSPHALSIAGVVAIAVVALVAAGFALSDSTPSSAPTLTLSAGSARAPALPRTTTTTPATSVQSLPAPTTTLKPGDSGAQVKTLQRELKALGFSTGGIDGSYGSQTSKAVAAFQRAHHLTADGIVGPQTLKALSP